MALSRSLQRSVDRFQRALETYPEEQRIKLITSHLYETTVSRRVQLVVKRLIDIVGAIVGLAVTMPFVPLIALMIRLDSPGRAIFRQQRIGKNGKPFPIFKFRSLRSDSPQYAEKPDEGNDPRLTRVGRLLRRSSCDEVPQLWNVLVGHMSLVGPRPEMPFIVDGYTPLQRVRLLAKPGITGLWQISDFRGDPIHEHMEYDLYYIRHFSLLLDLRIAAATITSVIRGKGAH